MSVETIPQLFLRAVESHDKRDAFRRKIDGRYADISHREVFEDVHNATLGLKALKIAQGDRIALLSENRLEWVVADLAILSSGAINVPVYPTLPAGQIQYILADSEARAVFVSTQAQLEKILMIRDSLPMLEQVICFDPGCDEAGVITLPALLERGKLVEQRADLSELIATIGRDDWASIIYTSGTTGEPKGVVLTHWNFLSNAIACLDVLELGPSDTCLSFLPLSHVFERTAGYYVMMHAGVTIAYAESIETVAENLVETGPTVVCSVPRLYEKMYARILEKVEAGSAVKQKLFHWAVGAGHRFVEEKFAGGASFTTKRKLGLANALVFKKLRARTGGRLRFFVSGGAPLAREIAEFFYAAGIPVMEGYGLTETSPVIAVNTFDDFRFGTVGKVLPGVEVRIAEDGEILARGPSIMHGYYKQPVQTKEVLAGGWFHTGDIGEIDADGFLRITDRKKDIIVTSGGKNIAPQPIENALKTSRYIGEAVLVGDRRKFIACLIVPNFEALEQFASETGLTYHDRPQLIELPAIVELYEREVNDACATLASYQQIKRFTLLPREFTLEAGELTPKLNFKRKVIVEKYAREIDALYAE